MKTTKWLLLLSLSIGLVFSSCKKDDDEQEEVPEFIDPADANALTSVLIMPAGTNNPDGNPPAPSPNNAPEVTNPINTLTSSNGSTTPLQFFYSNVSGNLGGCYVQIDGADSYFNVPYNSNSGDAGSLAVPIGIPTNVLEGSFDVNFCVYNSDGTVSNVVSTTVTVLQLGTGSLQISLSWNTATDQDLHVIDPDGFEIYYVTDESPSGGVLDRDDTNGFGPENIYWKENAPDGEFKVSVNDYENTSTPNTVYVTVSTKDRSKQFTATTQNGDKVDIVTIRKSGDNYEF